jgi:hypothetical protein
MPAASNPHDAFDWICGWFVSACLVKGIDHVGSEISDIRGIPGGTRISLLQLPPRVHQPWGQNVWRSFVPTRQQRRDRSARYALRTTGAEWRAMSQERKPSRGSIVHRLKSRPESRSRLRSMPSRGAEANSALRPLTFPNAKRSRSEARVSPRRCGSASAATSPRMRETSSFRR